MPKELCGRQLAVGTHSSRERSGLGAGVQESAAESSGWVCSPTGCLKSQKEDKG